MMILTLFVALGCYILVKVLVNSEKSGDKLIPPSGNLLIFDTETNGFPIDWKASLYDTENWPRIISIAWFKIAPNGQKLAAQSFIVKADFPIIIEAEKIHGISNSVANNLGVSVKEILSLFDKEILDCKYLIAHNIEFDFAVLFSEYLRLNIDTTELSSIKQICTMKQSLQYCKIPTKKGYKYPKLSELYEKLFSTKIINAHNANTDAEVCMECFKELYNKKIIKF